LAVELKVPILPEEMRTLNRLRDTAISDGVTEHARLTTTANVADHLDRAGMVVHEIRGVLTTALSALEALKQGTVGINDSTGMLLGRSLRNLHTLPGLLDGFRCGEFSHLESAHATSRQPRVWRLSSCQLRPSRSTNSCQRVSRRVQRRPSYMDTTARSWR
jgi:chloramphenicol 3-O-phosphotransferase